MLVAQEVGKCVDGVTAIEQHLGKLEAQRLKEAGGGAGAAIPRGAAALGCNQQVPLAYVTASIYLSACICLSASVCLRVSIFLPLFVCVCPSFCLSASIFLSVSSSCAYSHLFCSAGEAITVTICLSDRI